MSRIHVWWRRLHSDRRCIGCGYGLLPDIDLHHWIWNCPRCGTEFVNRRSAT